MDKGISCKDRFLLGKSPADIKELAYLLVTYAIELRAGELYPLYHTALRDEGSSVQVKSILLEEKEHLQEMEAQLSHIEGTPMHIEKICQIEAHFFGKWLTACHVQDKYLSNTKAVFPKNTLRKKDFAQRLPALHCAHGLPERFVVRQYGI